MRNGNILQSMILTVSMLTIGTVHSKERLMPLNDLDWIQQLPTSELFDVTPSVQFTKEEEGKCPGAELAILVGQQIINVPINDDGSAALKVSPEYFNQNAQIRMRKHDDAGTCKLAMNVAFGLKQPNKTFRYNDFMTLQSTYDKIIDAQAGVWAFMAPDFAGVRFLFAPEQSAQLTLRHADGTEQTLTASQGSIELKLEKRLSKANPELRFSVPALRIEPMTED